MIFFCPTPQPRAAARLAFTLAALILGSAAAHAASDLTGFAQAKDGDGLFVRGREIRLHGVDAPEWNQPCTDAAGHTWYAGREAAAWLASTLAGRALSCATTGRDRYKRLLATCYTGGADLNQALVAAGWAFAYRYYSLRYVADEEAARAAGKGIWAGHCEAPWDWRRKKRAGR